MLSQVGGNAVTGSFLKRLIGDIRRVNWTVIGGKLSVLKNSTNTVPVNDRTHL